MPFDAADPASVRDARGARLAGRSPLRDRRLVWLAIALFAVALLPGCTAFRGARAYQRGSEALGRGDAALAIAELENAAMLLPHASEIQNHLGIAYAMGGHEAFALAAFRRAVELDCDNQAAVRNLAGAEQAAAQEQRSLLTSEPETPR